MLSKRRCRACRLLLAVGAAAFLILASASSGAAASALTLSMTATWSGAPSPAAAGYGANPGEAITYHLVITNPATRVCNWDPESRRQVCYWDGLQATGVVVTDTLPSGVTFVSATGDNHFACGLTGGLVTCSNGSIGPGQNASIWITVQAPSASGPAWPVGSFEDVITNAATVAGGASASLQTPVLFYQ